MSTSKEDNTLAKTHDQIARTSTYKHLSLPTTIAPHMLMRNGNNSPPFDWRTDHPESAIGNAAGHRLLDLWFASQEAHGQVAADNAMEIDRKPEVLFDEAEDEYFADYLQVFEDLVDQDMVDPPSDLLNEGPYTAHLESDDRVIHGDTTTEHIAQLPIHSTQHKSALRTSVNVIKSESTLGHSPAQFNSTSSPAANLTDLSTRSVIVGDSVRLLVVMLNPGYETGDTTSYYADMMDAIMEESTTAMALSERRDDVSIALHNLTLLPVKEELRSLMGDIDVQPQSDSSSWDNQQITNNRLGILLGCHLQIYYDWKLTIQIDDLKSKDEYHPDADLRTALDHALKIMAAHLNNLDRTLDRILENAVSMERKHADFDQLAQRHIRDMYQYDRTTIQLETAAKEYEALATLFVGQPESERVSPYQDWNNTEPPDWEKVFSEIDLHAKHGVILGRGFNTHYQALSAALNALERALERFPRQKRLFAYPSKLYLSEAKPGSDNSFSVEAQRPLQSLELGTLQKKSLVVKDTDLRELNEVTGTGLEIVPSHGPTSKRSHQHHHTSTGEELKKSTIDDTLHNEALSATLQQPKTRQTRALSANSGTYKALKSLAIDDPAYNEALAIISRMPTSRRTRAQVADAVKTPGRTKRGSRLHEAK